MKFILASSNEGKTKEILNVLKPIGIDIVKAKEQIEVAETGTTYTENALLKAEAYYKKFGEPTVADDSGLSLNEFPNILGVYSARFAPELNDYAQKCDQLLHYMIENKAVTRKAAFICVLCFYLAPDQYFFFEGNMAGTIAHQRKGVKGFGYDPIFIPDGESFTLAEQPEYKAQNSHRARALIAAKAYLENYFKSKNSLPNV